MKKLISSIFLTILLVICANATEPLDKLPAIVIDTIYVSSGTLVIEYEVLRPFDQVGLSVQSSRNMAINDAKSVFLSGNTGKGKIGVPISLKTDQATHFNVFLLGGQFVNKADMADYHPSGYDYAIFKKQNDNTVKQFRTQYTEEEKFQMDEQIKNKVFIRYNEQLADVAGSSGIIDLSDSTKRSVNERYDDPLAIDTYEIKAIPMHQNDSITGALRAGNNYIINISGYVRTKSAANGWSTYIPATNVFLLFRNSNYPNNMYVFYHPNYPYTLFEGVHYSRTDGTGNFSFNFSINANLSDFNFDEAVIFVARDNDYVFLNVPGTTLYGDVVPVFLENEHSTIAIDHHLQSIQATNKEITVNEFMMASSLGMFWYAGNMLNKLGYGLSKVPVYETNASDYSGQFNYLSSPKINLSKKRNVNSYAMFGSPAHEYGHFVNYMIWGMSTSKMYSASQQTKESFAMFYSYASRHFAYKNGFGLSTPPGVSSFYELVRTESNNLDIAPFTSPKYFGNNYKYYFSYPDEPTYGRWASYLWELFDGHPTFQYSNSDNDDIAYPQRVINTWQNLTDITNFPNAFKNGLSTKEKASINGIYDFTVGNWATGMRSQNFNTASMSTTSDNLVVNFTYQPYGMQQHFNINSYNIRNLPTSFRVYGQRFTNCPWELIGEMPYNVNQTSYTQTFSIANPKFYNYKLTVNNVSGESAYPYLLTYHYDSDTCPVPAIAGPSTVCFDGSSFALINHPSNMLTWTVTGPFSFSSTSSITSTTVLSPTVYRTANLGGSGTLSVHIGGSNVVISKTVDPCTMSISGPNEVCCDGSEFTLINPPAGDIYWVVGSPHYFHVNPTGNPTTVTCIVPGSSSNFSLFALSGSGALLADKTITTCATTKTFAGETVNTPLTIGACDIDIQNVTINAELTIKATGVITIHDNVVINSPGKLILETLNSGRVVIDDKFDLSSGGFEIK